MAEYMTTDSELTSVANAIRAKGGTSSPLSYPQGYISAINAIPTGEAETFPDLGVTYIDYDGTVIATYTKEEFAELSAHPANPTHSGLTAQGWNWTLADAQAFVAAEGGLIIGQNYVTDDGKTRIYITIENGISLDSYTYTIYGKTVSAQSADIIINWGDGNTTTYPVTTSYQAFKHTYTSSGDYIIQIYSEYQYTLSQSSSTGNLFSTSLAATSDRVKSNSVKKVELGLNYVLNTYIFNYCGFMETITIPQGVMSVLNDGAFANCNSLKAVVIPQGVTSIGASFLSNCYSLLYLSIPNTVTTIATLAFANCRTLQTIIFPYNITTLTFTMQNCYNLLYVILPKNILTISGGLFSGCASLTMVKYVEKAEDFSGHNTFNSCYSLGSIQLSNKVTTLGSYFAAYTKIKNMTLPDTVDSLDTYCFYYCANLENITLTNKITAIPSYAFYYCSSLKSIAIPNTVTSIGTYGFANCRSIKEITIPNTVNSLDIYTFYCCDSLIKITLPTNTTTIPNYFLNTCSALQTVENTANITSIGSNAFATCTILKNITIPNSVTTISDYAFSNCQLINFDLPTSLRTIGTRAFQQCHGMTRAVFPEGVTSIPSYCFYQCRGLIYVSIPSTVTEIGASAFNGCSCIGEMHLLPETPPSLGSNALANISQYGVIYVPQGYLSTYGSATNWSAFAGQMIEDIEYTKTNLDESSLTVVNYAVNTSSYVSSTNGGYVIPLNGCKRVELKFDTSLSGTLTVMAFLSEYDPSVSLTTYRIGSTISTASANAPIAKNVPDGAQYLFLNRKVSSEVTPFTYIKFWYPAST